MSKQLLCKCCGWMGYKSQLDHITDDWLAYDDIPCCPKCGSFELDTNKCSTSLEKRRHL